MNTPAFTAALRRCVVVLLSAALASVALAQSPASAPKAHMLTIAYMKPEPGKAADYVKLERELWKPVHQDMVNKGRLVSWRLYAVSWPNGEEQEYDYVTLMEYPSFADMESPYIGPEMAQVLGEEKFGQLQSQTGAMRKLRRTDTLVLLHATEGWSTAANQILNVHYLRSLPGKGGDLMKIQREHYLPSNEELVKAGGATGWATSRVRYPAQMDGPYDYVSFNGYESLAQMEKQPSQAWRDKWAGEQTAAIAQQLAASRKRVKGELWRLIEQTTSATKPAT